MSVWRRPRKRPPSDQAPSDQPSGDQPSGEPPRTTTATAEEHADVLAGRADQLAMSQPGSRAAIEAAEQFLAVAEQLTAVSGALDNRRRLARALWRRTSAHFVAEDFPVAAESAQRCWAMCLELLDSTAADAAAFDETVGLVVRWCGMLGPALAIAGLQREADQMAEVVYDISARAQGPRGRQARARNSMAELSRKADAFKQADLDGRGRQIADDVQEAVALARDGAEVLRDHAAEGPYDAADLARMLQVLSRLYVVAGQINDAVATLDEAISVAETVASQGPNFAQLLRQLRTERDGGPTAAVGERAFQRAARDLGENDAGLFPGDVAEAAAVIDRLSGPLRGLAMARYAHLLASVGRPAEARDLAAKAIRQLMLFSDTPDQIQAALAVALTVDAAARQAMGDHAGARKAQDRAAAIRTILLRRDSTYADDLGPP
jgi:tetratricopeptide (TPR) repeat protein